MRKFSEQGARWALPVWSRLIMLLLLAGRVAWAQEEEGHAKKFFKVFPVGTVEKKAGTTCLKIADKYAKALNGLDGFSHVIVLYWFDKNDTPSKRSILQTRLDRFPNKPSAGVFASRAPVRPNLIALSVCRILSVDGSTVRVQSIDAFDGTPILDLKPHIPMIDSPRNVKMPDWWQPGSRLGQGRGGPGGGQRRPGGFRVIQAVESTWAAIAFEVKVDNATLEKARPYLQKAWDERKKLIEDSAGNFQVIADGMTKIKADLDEKLKTALTEEQMKKLAEWEESRQQRPRMGGPRRD